MGPGKTQALLHVRGAGSSEVRNRVAQDEGIPSVAVHGGPMILRVGHTYKHMGSIACATCDPRPEVSRRIGQAHEAFRQLAPRFHCQHAFGDEVKHHVNCALCNSRLMHDMGLWHALPPKLLAKIDSFRISMWRHEKRLLNAGKCYEDRVSDDVMWRMVEAPSASTPGGGQA